jgi:hypothetical protein
MFFPLANFDQVYDIGAAGFWLSRWPQRKRSPRRVQVAEEIDSYILEQESVADTAELFV